MTDWTTVWVGITTGVAALGGGVVTAWAQGRVAERRAAHENRRQARAERRDAYVDLLYQIEAVRSAALGCLASRQQLNSKEYGPSFVSARVKAAFLAPPDVWAHMVPLVAGAVIHMNAAAGFPNSEDALAELVEFTEDPARWHGLMDEYVGAARNDLQTG